MRACDAETLMDKSEYGIDRIRKDKNMKNLRIVLSLLAAILTLGSLPAKAQFSFTLPSATQFVQPGTIGLTFSGTLTNYGATALAFGQDPYFNLLTGPVGVDLSTFPIYFDDFYGPNSLAPGQTVSRIFSVDIDPSAALGKYTGNISFSYGGHTAGQDLTVNVVPASVPEAGTLPLLALGVSYIGYVLFASRRRAAARR